jgi:hypothetical protein
VSVALGAAHGSTGAAIVEDQTIVSVKVRTADGRDVERNIRVALFLESSAPQPRPVLVLNHGRAGSAADRAELRTSDYAAAARWLTGFGFIVAVPVRVGYGVTGGEVFSALGFPVLEARSRAFLLYTYVVGESLIPNQGGTSQRSERARFVESLIVGTRISG